MMKGLVLINIFTLFLLVSCDSVNNLEIRNQNIDSLFVDGISSDIYVYGYNQNFDSIIQNGRMNILLKEGKIITFGDAINELQVNDILIDTLIIFTRTDTLHQLYSQQEIYELFKNNKRFLGGYRLDVEK